MTTSTLLEPHSKMALVFDKAGALNISATEENLLMLQRQYRFQAALLDALLRGAFEAYGISGDSNSASSASVPSGADMLRSLGGWSYGLCYLALSLESSGTDSGADFEPSLYSVVSGPDLNHLMRMEERWDLRVRNLRALCVVIREVATCLLCAGMHRSLPLELREQVYANIEPWSNHTRLVAPSRFSRRHQISPPVPNELLVPLFGRLVKVYPYSDGLPWSLSAPELFGADGYDAACSYYYRCERFTVRDSHAHRFLMHDRLGSRLPPSCSLRRLIIRVEFEGSHRDSAIEARMIGVANNIRLLDKPAGAVIHVAVAFPPACSEHGLPLTAKLDIANHTLDLVVHTLYRTLGDLALATEVSWFVSSNSMPVGGDEYLISSRTVSAWMNHVREMRGRSYMQMLKEHGLEDVDGA
jgi:hypothetical protein